METDSKKKNHQTYCQEENLLAIDLFGFGKSIDFDKEFLPRLLGIALFLAVQKRYFRTSKLYVFYLKAFYPSYIIYCLALT